MYEFEGKKCVIYTRVSSKGQILNWNWLQSQETACKERAKKNWVEVIKVFKDWWVSWKYSSREWLDNMIDFLIKSNKDSILIDFVLSDDIDRLSRDVEWWIGIKRKIIKKGKADIQTVKQRLDNENIEWTLNQNLLMAFKQYERENNARRSIDRKRARLLEWYRVFPTPLWYEYTWRWSSKILKPTDEWLVISEALNLYADWFFSNNVEFSLYINDKMPHIPIRTAEKVLLENRLLFYAWFIDYPNYWVRMVNAKHEPLISVETLEKLNEKLHKKTYFLNVTRDTILEHMPLRKHLCCPICWRPFSWWPSKNKIGNLYYYYRCFNNKCPNNKSINAEKVHKAFWEFLKTLEIKDSTIECFKIVLEELYEKECETIRKWNKKAESELKECETQINKFIDLITKTDNINLINIYEWKINELDKKKSILTKKMNTTNEIMTKQSYTSLINFTMSIIKSPYNLRASHDYELIQLVPSVVIWWNLYMDKDFNFTTLWDTNFNLLFNELNNSNYLKSVRVGFEPTIRCRMTR